MKIVKINPDGSRISFSAFYYGDTESYNAIAVLDASSGEVQTIYGFGPGYFLGNLGWSPSGTYNLISVYEEDYHQTYLYKVNPDNLEDYAELYGPAYIYDAHWGELNPSKIEEEHTQNRNIPISVSISPNPTKFSTQINYAIPGNSKIKVEIFDILGRTVRVWERKNIPAGEHTIVWDGLDDDGTPLPPGVYVCRIMTEFGNNSVKIVRTK
ncbi:hypothetical protein DRQ33_04170 [bacterium]|nr:MAG: hypothetical protein DRQ33_04170 [bacterium]